MKIWNLFIDFLVHYTETAELIELDVLNLDYTLDQHYRYIMIEDI